MADKKEPNIITEMYLSMIKIFIWALVITNLITSLIWASVHYGYFSKSFANPTETEINQTSDGDFTQNNQSINR